MDWTLLRKLIFTSTLLLISSVGHTTNTSSNTHFGLNLSVPLVTTDPHKLYATQLMLDYYPAGFQWGAFSLYFDGGFSYFWTTSTPNHRSLYIISAAPVLRYTFPKLIKEIFTPYAELSVGPAYLSRTRIDHHNLGMHYAFQDRLGIGTLIGKAQHFSLGAHAVHYSNAHLSAHNRGMSVPVMLDVGYRF
jgi:hypothetical protein